MTALTSREYKMMLQASKFNGSAEQLSESATALWQDLASVILPNAIAVSGTEDVSRRRRQVRFLDTDDHWLRQNDYVVRERTDLDSNERQLTLKFRHPDRFYSQDRTMEPSKEFDHDMKFEEDIKPAFQSLYSYFRYRPTFLPGVWITAARDLRFTQRSSPWARLITLCSRFDRVDCSNAVKASSGSKYAGKSFCWSVAWLLATSASPIPASSNRVGLGMLSLCNR